MPSSQTFVATPPASRLMAARRQAVRVAARVNLPLVGIVVVVAALATHFALRISHWAVMTDELQYVRLGISAGNDFSPVPHIHGQYFPSFAQVYPILIAPFLHFFSMPHAWRIIHALNAVLMASTAIPAYLLAREVVRSKPAALFVAAASVLVPWMVLSTTVLTEVAAYPVFTWAALAIYRATAAPSPRRDLAAIGAMALAFFTRPQFLSLALILPLCILAVEVRSAAQGSSPRAAVRAIPAAVWRGHRVLIAAYGLVVVYVLFKATQGPVSDLLGTYANTTNGPVFPAGIWRSMRGHLDYIMVGAGVVPAVLAGAWAVPSLIRPRDRNAHAFAVLVVAAVVVITYQAAAFNQKFTAGGVIQDRYNFFVVPLLFVGMAAFLLDSRRRTVALAVSGALAAVLIIGAEYIPGGLPFFASPDTVFHYVLAHRSEQLGNVFGIDHLRPSRVIFAGTLLLTAVGVWAFLRLPRRPVSIAACAAVLLFGATETGYVFTKVAPARVKGDLSGADPIDQALPADAVVGAVPSKVPLADASPFWWDLELWNKTVRYSYSFNASDQFTPFPRNNLWLDWASGSLRADRTAPYLVFIAADTRFRVQGKQVPTRAIGFELWKAQLPYRAAWTTRGLDSGSWAEPSKPVTLRLYRESSSPERRVVTVRLEMPPPVAHPRTFRLTAGGAEKRGRLQPGAAMSVSMPVCVSPSVQHTDVSLLVNGITQGAAEATHGVLVTRVDVRRERSPC